MKKLVTCMSHPCLLVSAHCLSLACEETGCSFYYRAVTWAHYHCIYCAYHCITLHMVTVHWKRLPRSNWVPWWGKCIQPHGHDNFVSNMKLRHALKRQIVVLADEVSTIALGWVSKFCSSPTPNLGRSLKERCMVTVTVTDDLLKYRR